LLHSDTLTDRGADGTSVQHSGHGLDANVSVTKTVYPKLPGCCRGLSLWSLVVLKDKVDKVVILDPGLGFEAQDLGLGLEGQIVGSDFGVEG